jgi:hypothetical protein
MLQAANIDSYQAGYNIGPDCPSFSDHGYTHDNKQILGNIGFEIGLLCEHQVPPTTDCNR